MPGSFTTASMVWSKSPPINSLQAYGLSSGALLEHFIGPVEAEIVGKVSTRYTPVGVFAEGGCPVLVGIATREAIYRVLVERSMLQFPPPQQGRHPLYQQHLDDQALLKAIGEGTVKLITGSGNVVNADLNSAGMEIWHNNMDYHPTMREDAVENQFMDQRKISDIDDDREEMDNV